MYIIMLPTVEKQCVLGIIRNPFGEPVMDPVKLECEKCAMVLVPSRLGHDSLCPNCLKNLST
jgi:hypothetical protein